MTRTARPATPSLTVTAACLTDALTVVSGPTALLSAAASDLVVVDERHDPRLPVRSRLRRDRSVQRRARKLWRRRLHAVRGELAAAVTRGGTPSTFDANSVAAGNDQAPARTEAGER